MRGFHDRTAMRSTGTSRAMRGRARVVNGRRSRGAGRPGALTTRRSAAASMAPAGRPQAAGLAASAAPGLRLESPGTELVPHRGANQQIGRADRARTAFRWLSP